MHKSCIPLMQLLLHRSVRKKTSSEWRETNSSSVWRRFSSEWRKTTSFGRQPFLFSLPSGGRQHEVVFHCSEDNLFFSLFRTEKENKRLNCSIRKTTNFLSSEWRKIRDCHIVGHPTHLERALMCRPSMRPASVKSQAQRLSPDVRHIL